MSDPNAVNSVGLEGPKPGRQTPEELADRRETTELISRLRSQATRLRGIADQLNDEANRLETDGLLIGGHEIAEVAAEVLREQGRPLGYHELRPLIEAASGRRIRGREPKKTLVANLHRHPLIVPLGDGMFTVTPSEPPSRGLNED